ncbi:MAG: hypothetical protein ABSF45_29550 [Terriglobia bacterium]|jgi:hypothetical protein
MVGASLQSVFTGFLKLALLAGAALYAGLVLMSSLTAGSYLRPQVDWRDSVRSAGRWAVWLGVRALAMAVRVATPIFAMLSEASAEVGEWFLDRRHHEIH